MMRMHDLREDEGYDMLMIMTEGWASIASGLLTLSLPAYLQVILVLGRTCRYAALDPAK